MDFNSFNNISFEGLEKELENEKEFKKLEIELQSVNNFENLEQELKKGNNLIFEKKLVESPKFEEGKIEKKLLSDNELKKIKQIIEIHNNVLESIFS